MYVRERIFLKKFFELIRGRSIIPVGYYLVFFFKKIPHAKEKIQNVLLQLLHRIFSSYKWRYDAVFGQKKCNNIMLLHCCYMLLHMLLQNAAIFQVGDAPANLRLWDQERRERARTLI